MCGMKKPPTLTKRVGGVAVFCVSRDYAAVRSLPSVSPFGDPFDMSMRMYIRVAWITVSSLIESA